MGVSGGTVTGEEEGNANALTHARSAHTAHHTRAAGDGVTESLTKETLYASAAVNSVGADGSVSAASKAAGACSK